MLLIETQLTASEVLRTFHRDEPYLFLGAAFSTAAIVAAGLCIVRRRFDKLLICFAVFAYLYGQRLWLQAGILRLTVPDNPLFNDLRDAINFLVPIPAFLYFRFAGFLGERRRAFSIGPSLLFLGLAIATFVFGPHALFRTINNGMVLSIMWALAISTWRKKDGDRDFAVVRWGLLAFVLLALWDNMVSAEWLPKLEPFGFAAFLGCLAFVTARRVQERDIQLDEIAKELELARRIQRSILPAAFPESASFRVAARYVPMTSVAGDFYDFPVASAKEAGLLIADVSGHGVPAALIASMVKMAATAQRANASDPARLLTGMNDALWCSTQSELVTAAYAHLDAEKGELRYAAAGHPAMLLVRRGAVSEVAENGMPLGAMERSDYSARAMALEAGDRLVLYTDGLVEARSSAGAMFGDAALQAVASETAQMDPAEAADAIVARVQGWARSQDDDLTLLVCDYLGRA